MNKKRKQNITASAPMLRLEALFFAIAQPNQIRIIEYGKAAMRIRPVILPVDDAPGELKIYRMPLTGLRCKCKHCKAPGIDYMQEEMGRSEQGDAIWIK